MCTCICVGMWAVPCRDQWHQIVLEPQLQVVKARIIMGVRNWTRVLCNRAHGLHRWAVSSPQWPLLKHWRLVNCQSDLCFPTHHVLNLASLPVVHGAELPDPTSVLKLSVVEVTTYFFIRHFILKDLFRLLQIKSIFFTCHFTETNLVGNTQLKKRVLKI